MDKQLLHLVFGGQLEDLNKVRFNNVEDLDIVGIFPNYRSAYNAWKAAAQGSVDNAKMRYFIVHMHKLIEPEEPSEKSPDPDDHASAPIAEPGAEPVAKSA